MVSFTRDDLLSLAGTVSPACISIYIPPRHAGSAVRIDMTRARNLVRKARIALTERIADPVFVDDVMRPLETLTSERELWRDPEHGVAIFRAPELLRMFRLPVDVPEIVRVDTCFDLLPLVELAVDDGTFFILSIGRRDVKLYRATRQVIIDQSLGTTPVSFDEYLASLDHRRSSQVHGAQSAALGTAAGASHRKAGAIFHATATRRERAKMEFEGFLRAIDRRVVSIIGSSRAPLVLAGVGAARAMYRGVSTYPGIVRSGLGTIASSAALHRSAWELVAPVLLAGHQSEIDLLRQRAGSSKASFDGREILARSRDGEVGTLFLATDNRHWPIGARFDGTGVEPLGRMINNVVRTAGSLCIVHDRMPNDAPVAALFRY